MRTIILIGIILLLVLNGCSEESYFGSEAHKVDLDWACMDGCYDMQLIYEEEFNITKSSDRHDLCSLKCYDRYMNK